ncbi:TPA: tail fiber protein, partial [Morganella morganii]|nr:tail fiber protein [Morganella morganii]
MQQWMTDTGQVEIELPNGQKVTLDSIKALNDALSNLSQKVDDIKIPELKDASINQKGIVQLTEKIGDSETLAPHQKAVRDGINALNSSIG